MANTFGPTTKVVVNDQRPAIKVKVNSDNSLQSTLPITLKNTVYELKYLNQLSDVEVVDVANGHVLFYSEANTSWINTPFSIHGTDSQINVAASGHAYTISLPNAVAIANSLVVGNTFTTNNSVTYIANGNFGTILVANATILGSTLTLRDIIPDANNVYTIGTPEKRFATLYLSGDTFYLGNAVFEDTNTALYLTTSVGDPLPLNMGNTAVTGSLSVTGAFEAESLEANTLTIHGMSNLVGGITTANISAAYINAIGINATSNIAITTDQDNVGIFVSGSNGTNSSAVRILSDVGGYGRMEFGGSAGAYLDFKTPDSDDYDMRMLVNTSIAEIVSTANNPLWIHTYGNTVTIASGTGTIINGGNVNIDSGTLFVDTANNRVGIGNTTPAHTLSVNGSGNFTSSLNVATTFASGNATITGFANVVGNLQVTDTITGNNLALTGNLTVSGTTTFINTTNLNVGDNIITLNADLGAGATPTENSGIEVNRGASANATLLWNEADDKWTINNTLNIKSLSGGNPAIELDYVGASNTRWFAYAGPGYTGFGTDDTSPMIFYNAASEKFRINSTGASVTGLFGAGNTTIATPGTSVLRIHANTDTTPVAQLELMRGANATWGADAYTDYRIRTDSGNFYIQSQSSGGTVYDWVTFNEAGNYISFKPNTADEQFRILRTASAVNYIQVTGNVTGSGPILSAQGTDTNIDLLYSTKGTAGSHVFRTNSTVRQFQVNHVTSAVNYATVVGSITGAGPIFGVAGSDANIDVNHITKGTGAHIFQTGATSATQVRIVDNAGANRYVELRGGVSGTNSPAVGGGGGTAFGVYASGGGGINFFTNGYETDRQFVVSHTAGATNYGQITGSTGSSAVTLSAQGANTNIAFTVGSKGSGDINLSAGSGGWVSFNAGGVRQVAVKYTASAVNYITLNGGPAGSDPTIDLTYGTDTDIGINILTKGAGIVKSTGPVQVETDTVVTTKTLTTTAITANQVIATFAGATYRSAEFIIQATDTTGTKYQKTKMLAVHNGTTAEYVEYGNVNVGGDCGTFDVSYSSGIQLRVTPSSTNSTVFKVTCILTKV